MRVFIGGIYAIIIKNLVQKKKVLSMKNNFILACLVALSLNFTVAAATEVEFHTSEGLIAIKVDELNAPATAGNFLQYVQSGFYDGLIFHRVIPGFVIQGGGFDKQFNQRQTNAPIAYEVNSLKNVAYSLSMARTNDPNSATSQFFINLQDNVPLDGTPNRHGYVVFGNVIEGIDVVNKIAKVKTVSHQGHRDVPAKRIIINKAVVR